MTVEDMIKALGGHTVVAEATRADRNTVIYWERRGRVPVRVWPVIIRLARDRGVDRVTAETLQAFWCNPQPKRPSEAA